MPTSKDLKRLARSRMKKTGESYTAARAQLIAKRTTKAAAAVDYAKKAGTADAAVRKATGRDWKSWVAELDAVEATKLTHRDIARHVQKTYNIGDWWSQMVTVGYERIRDLRDRNQRRGGGYEVNKSKTIAVPVGKLYSAFATARGRASWLGDVALKVKKSTPNKTLRMLWPDGSPLEAYFLPKGPAKSQVTLQHRELPTAAAAEKMRQYWTERLADLADRLTVRKR
jgi:hypothetical protein